MMTEFVRKRAASPHPEPPAGQAEPALQEAWLQVAQHGSNLGGGHADRAFQNAFGTAYLLTATCANGVWPASAFCVCS